MQIIKDIIDHLMYTVQYYEFYAWCMFLFLCFLVQVAGYARWRKLYLPPFSHYEVQEKDNKT